MKKILSIISIILIMILMLVILTGCTKNENNNDSKNSSSAGTEVTSKYSWPDLTAYGISDFEKGKITDITATEGQDNFLFNYEIEVENITKADIDEFTKSFKDWTVVNEDSRVTIVKADGISQYSVVISFEEDSGKATIIMCGI